jgi:hypothetical protein
MWKSFVNALIESCVACDPNVYMYWRTAQLEAEAPARPEPEGSPSRDASRPTLKLLRGRSEASA